MHHPLAKFSLVRAGIVSNPAIIFLTSGTFSAASALDLVLTSYISYRALRFVLTNLTVNTDGEVILIRTSTDGGANYDVGASDYAWGQWNHATSTNLTVDLVDSEITINSATGIGNAADEHAELEVTVFNQTAARRGLVYYAGLLITTVGVPRAVSGAGARLASADIDAIRFVPSIGTFSGSYAIYGYM